MTTKWAAAAMAALATLAYGQDAFARSNDWERISRRLIPRQLINETILVGNELGRFTRLRLRAERGNLVVRSMRVTFDNGRRSDLLDGRRLRLRSGEQQTIDLPGNARFIRRIVLETRTRRQSGRVAILDIQGQSSGGIPGRFELLETTEYNSANATIDIPVGREEGRFTVIRLRPLDRDIRVREVEYVYGNGRARKETLNARIAAGKRSEPIVIARQNRDGRFLRGVRVRVRPTNQPRLARMQLLGRDGPFRNPDARPGRDDRPSQSRLIGDRTADLRDDSVSVPVRVKDRGELRIRPVGANIELRRVTVEYRDGRRRVVRIGERVGDRDFSSRLRLGQSNRDISRVLVYVAPRQRRGSYEIQVHRAGLDSGVDRLPGRTPPVTRPPRDPDIETAAGGWMKLGSRRAQLISKDTDTITVGRRFGRIDRMRITVRKNKVRLYGMQVTFGNGEVATLPFYGKVQRDTTTDAVDLPGKGRIVESIRLKYRSVFSLRGESRVEVWGRRARRGARDDERDPVDKLKRQIRKGVRDLLRQ